MNHLDDDELTSISFGESTPDASQREHLRTCSRCDAELTARTRLVGVGRSLRDVEIVQPPDNVWNGIHSALGLSPDLAAVPREPAQAAPVPLDAPHDVGRPAARGGRGGRSIRRRGTMALVAAAALVVGLVAGIAGASFLNRPENTRLVAEAELEPFPGWSASGSARVEEGTSSARRIVVVMSGPDEGLREVWLIDPETSGLISLGLLSGASGTFALPDDVDLGKYSVVDVSQEPDDGNPAHSGDSIVRGALRGT